MTGITLAVGNLVWETLEVRTLKRWIAIATLMAVMLAQPVRAAITVSFDLAVDKANNSTPVPANIQNEITSAIAITTSVVGIRRNNCGIHRF